MIGASGTGVGKAACWRPALGAALALVAGAAMAQKAGNAAAGHEVARTWCVSCHVVDAAQTTASAAGAPTFAAVAAMPSTTAATLHGFLNAPHPPMPNYQLSNTQIDDVAAYVLSLKAR